MISGLREAATFEPAGQAGPHREFAVRKAGMHDIGPILALINGYAAKGIMLPRTELEVSEDIRDFSVIVTDGRLMGCGALHFYTPSTAEIVCVHLRSGFFSQNGFSGSGARRATAQGLEGLRALPEVSMLRRDRGHARSAAGVP